MPVSPVRDFLTPSFGRSIVAAMIHKWLVISLLALIQFGTTCPLVQCDGADGHVQVEYLHGQCDNLTAVALGPVDPCDSSVTPSTCTDTLLGTLLVAPYPGGSSARDRVDLAHDLKPLDLLASALTPNPSAPARSVKRIDASNRTLYALRTVVLIV